MQWLVAVEEEVPRCQIQTHVSVCGCHIRLSAADKIQQQIAEFRGGWGGEVGRGALSLPCTPLLLLILHAIEFCACGLWRYFSFSKASSGLRRKPDSNGLLKAAYSPGEMYSGVKGSELPSVVKSLGVIFKLKRW